MVELLHLFWVPGNLGPIVKSVSDQRNDDNQKVQLREFGWNGGVVVWWKWLQLYTMPDIDGRYVNYIYRWETRHF